MAMPSAIGDSEDDEEVLVEDQRPGRRSQRSPAPGAVAHAADAYAAVPCEAPAEGAGHRSSLSTGELNKQIREAQRRFFASADEPSAASTPMAARTSPARPTADRRHSAVTGSLPAEKTRATYGSSKSTNVHTAADDPVLTALRDEDTAQHTSQSALFSDHSAGPNSGRALPDGTIQDDFLNHNPHVMFRHTGSTIAYNESSEQRMVEQALRGGPNPQSPAPKPAESEKDPSSPFPWSSANLTQTPRSNHSKQSHLSGTTLHVEEDSTRGIAEQPIPELNPVEEQALPEQMQDQTKLPQPHHAVHDEGQSEAQPSEHKTSAPPESRPPVIVHTDDTPKDNDDPSAQKAARGKKRRASATAKEESSEPLGSDDELIGLPKERYKPKPSRRRMTQLPNEPIDYSIAPESAAKKRRKTLNDAAADTQSFGSSASCKQSSTQNERSKQIEERKADETQTPNPTPSTPGKPTRGSPVRPIASPLTPSGRITSKTVKPSPLPAKASMQPPQPCPPATNMGPPSLPASSTKKKKVTRSHTTIFEDCSPNSQKLPSLSQQQAERRSALQGAGKKKTRATLPKRKIVQDDDDDDVDELSKEPDEETRAPQKRGRSTKAEAIKRAGNRDQIVLGGLNDHNDNEEPPRKRGRKPPATDAAQNVARHDEDVIVAQAAVKKGRQKGTSDKVLEDSEAEDGMELIADVQPEEPPKKQRGPPAKTRADGTADETPRPSESTSTEAVDTSALEADATALSVLKAKDVNAQQRTKETTPAPDTVKSSKENTPQPPSAVKPGPMSHSPIKKTNKILNHRVGLNKKSRIPPLLKVVRPVPQRKEVERVTKVTSVAELERIAAAKLEED